jgi:integrase
MPLKKKKHSNGVFYATGTVAGRRVRQSLGTRDKQQAEEARAQLEARLWAESVYGAGTTCMFEDAAVAYLQDGRDGRFLEPLLKHFRGRALRSIKPKDIRDAAKKLYPAGSAATLNRQVIAPARAVINHAAQEGWCDSITVRQFSVEKPKRTAIGADWILAFQKEAERRSNKRLSLLCRFLFETGTRISEAVRLTPADIDHVNRRANLGKLKNGEVGFANFSEALRKDLVDLAPINGRVFGYESRHSIYGVWKNVCKAAGIPYVPPHQAGRHSFASALHAAGWKDKDIADAGRWKSVRLVQDTYIHTEDRSLAAADLMGEKLANPSDPEEENAEEEQVVRRV